MSRLSVSVVAVSFAAAVGFGLAFVDRDQFRDKSGVLDESGLDATLREQLARNDATVKYKDYLVRELVAGRASLAEVADEFLRVNAEEPLVMDAVRRNHPGADDREKSAHHVLAFARARCLTEVEAEEVYSRLSAQFTELFGHEPAGVKTRA